MQATASPWPKLCGGLIKALPQPKPAMAAAISRLFQARPAVRWAPLRRPIRTLPTTPMMTPPNQTYSPSRGDICIATLATAQTRPHRIR